MVPACWGWPGMSRNRDPQYNLRISTELKLWLQEQGRGAKRSLNKEIIARLEFTRRAGINPEAPSQPPEVPDRMLDLLGDGPYVFSCRNEPVYRQIEKAELLLGIHDSWRVTLTSYNSVNHDFPCHALQLIKPGRVVVLLMQLDDETPLLALLRNRGVVLVQRSVLKLVDDVDGLTPKELVAQLSGV